MNQEKIGKFIAQERKHKKLTQKELADKLRLSEKTISKWECGKGLPEVSLMQPLCKELNISVNDLLNGEKDTKEEQAIIDYVNYEKKKSKKKIIILTTISILLITFILLTTIYFFNNYGKITAYELSGSTENFSLTGALFIKSNQNNILNTGKLTINNEEIKDEDIKAISLSYKDNIIYANYGKNLLSKYGTLIQESDGYNEYFSEEKINNIEDWTLTIEYVLNEETKQDVIDITTNELLKNDEIISLKDQPISEDTSNSVNRKEEIDKREKEEQEHIISVITKEGYSHWQRRFYIRRINKKEDFDIDTLSYTLRYSYYEDEKNNISMSEDFYDEKNTIFHGGNFMSGSGVKNGKNYNFKYDFETGELKIYDYPTNQNTDEVTGIIDEEEVWMYVNTFLKEYNKLQKLIYS